ncbi:hypothetical protein GF337_10750 [candidate division KSB1 bacterium]|nr:hypothetical protein [candidate division KSB1 bacterium]
MKKSAFLFLLTYSLCFAQNDKEYNWLAPSPGIQLDMEAEDDIKGLGRIFMPVMTNPDFEPVYTVSKADSVIEVQKMGHSVWVRPGSYKITFGSGTIDQLMHKEIQIRAEETRIIEPDWSGLTVRIIDETRDWLNEPYELFRIPEIEAYGIGYGADEQLGENLQTWILRPGLYKIVKLGENVNTYVNFATVRLLPGDLTQYTIVMDSETKQFLGAGVLEFGTTNRKIKNWTINSTLYGSFTLNHANDLTSKEQKTSMAFVAQLDYNIRYSTPKHYFLSRGVAEEGWNMQKDQNTFRSFLDNIRIKNVYIYYFLPGIGAYGRLFAETNLFDTKYYYDDSEDVYFYDEDGRLDHVRRYIRHVTLSPAFSPLELKEGIGLNLRLIKSLRTNFNIRVGMGFRQNINRDLFNQDEMDDTKLYRKPSAYLKGPEASFIGNSRIFRNIMITSELDLLLPSNTNEEIVYDWENNINLRLSKNISIDYTLRIKKDKTVISYIQYENILLFRYSYLIF